MELYLWKPPYTFPIYIPMSYHIAIFFRRHLCECAASSPLLWQTPRVPRAVASVCSPRYRSPGLPIFWGKPRGFWVLNISNCFEKPCNSHSNVSWSFWAEDTLWRLPSPPMIRLMWSKIIMKCWGKLSTYSPKYTAFEVSQHAESDQIHRKWVGFGTIAIPKKIQKKETWFLIIS